MSEAKPFASLSSGLLARKGAAKPAMRRPNANINPDYVPDNGQDDCGWNDMGYDVDPDISKEAPAEKPVNLLANAIEQPRPEVKQQQDRIAAQLQAINEGETAKTEVPAQPLIAPEVPSTQSKTAVENIEVKKPTSLIKTTVKKPRVSKKAGTAKARAAFTLRLDPERHLKLRLACAIDNISAQKFVTEALDKKLSEMEQVDHLSGQINEN